MGSRYGIVGLSVAVLLAAAMHYAVLRQGYANVVDSAQSNAGVIVEMTGAFVRTYSALLSRHTPGELPNPAIFRAAALSHVKGDEDNGRLTLTGVVGLPGREIAQVAQDDVTRSQLVDLEASPSTDVVSRVFVKNGQTTHRSLWAFVASEQACADCHNRLQNLTGNDRWQIGDLMGAQVVEQNIQPQLANVHDTAVVQCVLLFAAVLATWFCCTYLVNQFRLTRELKTLATIDPLTGCINRREFQDRVMQLEGRTDGALLMLDLDRFKLINDTYGHDMGDNVIRDFTRRIQGALRASDWMVRFGGEEFIVWLPDVQPVDAKQMAERLRQTAEQAQVTHNGSTIHYTVSIGLHIVQDDMPTRFENWIKSADRLVYQAKMQGRNRIAFEFATGG